MEICPLENCTKDLLNGKETKQGYKTSRRRVPFDFKRLLQKDTVIDEETNTFSA